MSDAVEFERNVAAILDSVVELLTEAERHEVRHFIDHDEAGEALRTLACILVEEDKPVHEATFAAIAKLAKGVFDADDLPPQVRRYMHSSSQSA